MKILKKKVKVKCDYHIDTEAGKGTKRKYIVIDLPPEFKCRKGEVLDVIVYRGVLDLRKEEENV